MYRTLALALLSMLPAPAMAQSTTAAPSAASSSAAPSAAAPSDAQLIALGRNLTDWWYLGLADSIYAHMSDDAKGKMPKDEFLDQRLQILARIGGEVEVVEEKMTLRKGNRQYWREAKVDLMTEESVVMRWVFSPEGQVVGLGINPASRAPAPD